MISLQKCFLRYKQSFYIDFIYRRIIKMHRERERRSLLLRHSLFRKKIEYNSSIKDKKRDTYTNIKHIDYIQKKTIELSSHPTYNYCFLKLICYSPICFIYIILRFCFLCILNTIERKDICIYV